jgi:hypothetical protein
MNKATMTFEVLPLGPCLACLEAMCDPARGRPAHHRDLGSGRTMWALYCEHNQAGAYTLVSARQTPQWHMVTPVEIETFLGMVAMTCDEVLRRLAPLESAKN